MSRPFLSYEVATGLLLGVNAQGEWFPIEDCYSGAPGFVNEPSATWRVAEGPIPMGEYVCEVWGDHPRLGPQAIYLRPDPGNEMFGRSEFFIHGDNSKGDNSASRGCIIASRSTRDQIASKISDAGSLRLVVTRGWKPDEDPAYDGGTA